MRIFSLSMSVLCLHLFVGCNYYRVKSIPDRGEQQYVSWLKRFNEAQKYIVLHQNGVSMHLKNAQIDETNLELTGIPSFVADEHNFDHNPRIDKAYRYKKNKQSPLNEVHLYLGDDVNMVSGESISIPITSINEIGYSDKASGKKVWGIIGIVVGVLALIVIIVALTKSSCPFVYVNDGEQWVFQGELYPGITIENAQKTDYIRLPAIKEVDGLYAIQISNELLEIQHTDEAILQVVDHQKNVSVMMDPSGNLYSIVSPLSPINAMADQKYDMTKAVMDSDGYAASFDSPNSDSDGTRSLELWFENNSKETTGKLLLSLKNSYWLDYAMGAFYKQFGDYYPEFQDDQQKTTFAKAFQWRSDQSLPLSVYVQTKDGWTLQHEINAVGPMHYRDIVVPLDLEKVDNQTLKVRLETGFKFWDIDKVALDYSDNVKMDKMQLVPHYAMDNYGKEAVESLSIRDKQYLIQEEVGDWVQIEYQSPPMQNEARTVFLKNTGYYTYKRNFSGEPDFEALKKFRNPGHFTQFAEDQYNALIEAIIAQKPEIVSYDEAN